MEMQELTAKNKARLFAGAEAKRFGWYMMPRHRKEVSKVDRTTADK